ncbi:L-asparagine permease [Serratia symbiotica str. 'Cinara cedri']|nr:L-asparagine permease [Serratia symbiotica str. 'Cinara cedri']
MESNSQSAHNDRRTKRQWLDIHETDYNKSMSSRQIQMIAIGGSIGTGLFLGTGGRLEIAGPALALVYLVCGVFSFFILRALGELILYRPTSGSFVSYAHEFLGEKASYIVGWMYFINWVMTGIVDITAVALYMHYWSAFSEVPRWLFALLALVIIAVMNIIGVKWFAEIEFWFSLIKVAAISIFLIIGVICLGTGKLVEGHTTGLHLIIENGGLFPHGVLPAIVLIQGVIFAFAGIELLGTAAGECQEPAKIMPKAINNIILRISIFYIGSILLLVLLLPWNAYHANQSPFVTFLSKLEVPYIDTTMNIVVLTAALSSLNSGLYSTSRILRALSISGSAPKFLANMSSHKVPYNSILMTCSIHMIGVLLNYLIPSKVFEIVLNIASLSIISSWIFIIICQMCLRKAIRAGHVKPVSFKMPCAPFTSWLTLAFLLMVIIMMTFDYPNGTYTIIAIPLLAIILILGWFSLRKRMEQVQQEYRDFKKLVSHETSNQ